MSEPVGVIGLVHLSPSTAREFFQTLWTERLARRAAEALDARDLLFFRYIEKEKAVLALDARQFGPAEPLLEGPVLKALLSLATEKDLPGEDLVVVSDSINNIASDRPFAAYSIGTGSARELGRPPRAPKRQLALLDEFYGKYLQLDTEAGERERLAWLQPAIARAYRREAKAARRRELEARIRSATVEEPVEIAKGYWSDGTRVLTGPRGKELPGADPFTFRRVHSSLDVTADVRHVWSFKRSVEGADASTFRVLGGADGIFAVDSGNAYILDGVEWRTIPGADPASFEDLDFGFARDCNHVYIRDEVLEGVSPDEGFRIDKCGFLHGKREVYHYGFRLSLDPASFEVVSYSDSTNPFRGPFRLRDRRGEYTFEREKKPKRIRS